MFRSRVKAFASRDTPITRRSTRHVNQLPVERNVGGFDGEKKGRSPINFRFSIFRAKRVRLFSDPTRRVIYTGRVTAARRTVEKLRSALSTICDH